jgi:hypothetical protein
MHALHAVISGSANTEKQLTKLIDEKPAFQWTPEVEAAFQTLNEALCTAPILACPQPRERFAVDTDASVIGIRGPTYRMDRSE